jgi:hypothetical protein
MRSLILFAAAILSTAAFAQKTTPKFDIAPSDRPADQKVVLKDVIVTANTAGPEAIGVNWDGSNAPQVAVVMDRDFRDAIQGNIDRETVERSNGETR